MSEVVTPAPFYWEAILVALGAVPGAWLRLRVVNHFEPVVPHKHWGTFVVNVLAAFFLGLFSGLHAYALKACSGVDGTAPMMLLVGVGFFGSLSTFSTFVVNDGLPFLVFYSILLPRGRDLKRMKEGTGRDV